MDILNDKLVLKPHSIGNGWYTVNLKQAENQVVNTPSVLVDSEEMILFGIGQKRSFPEVLDQIKEILPIRKLQYVVITSLETHIFSTMTAFANEGIQPTVIADERIVQLFHLMDLPNPILSINESVHQLILKSGRVLSFIRSPFLITPGSMMVYDAFGKTLYSNYLFETIERIPEDTHKKDAIDQILSFTQNFVPSSDFIRPVLSKLAPLEIDRAITQSGMVYEKEELKEFIPRLSAFEFFNSNIYHSKNADEKRLFDYSSLCNQVLLKYRSMYGLNEVLRCFESSELKLNPDTTELMESSIQGEKLWNRFFDIVYANRGIVWINVIEPLVNKLIDVIGISKPHIFQTALTEREKAVEKLDIEKTALVDRLVNVESSLKETKQQLIKDPKTNYYNETYLKQHLFHLIEKSSLPVSSETEIVLFYIQIDNILSINQKYSAKVGDETIRNLGYLLDQKSNEDDSIIKRNGPGFVLLAENLAGRDPVAFAQKLQNAAKESEAFIEPITLSIALVRLSEFANTESHENICEKMISTGENRIRAFPDGTGRLIDEKTKINRGKNGRILIADQEEINLRLLSSLFFNENYEVITAKDGLQALRLAEESPFDAIIVERTISKMDGLLIKQRINATPVNHQAIFILLTYNKTPEIVYRANLLEVDLVVQKPVIFEELAGFVTRMIGRRK